MLQEIQTVTPQVIAWTVAHKDILLSLLGGAAGISVFAQTVLHKLGSKLDAISPVKKKVYSFLLAQGLTALAALAAQLAANVDFLRLYPELATVVTAIHQLAVNPIYVKTVLPFLQYQAANAPETATPYGGEPVNSAESAGVSFVG